MVDTGHLLHQPVAACGQVADDGWGMQRESVEIDHVDVGLVARCQQSSVHEADGLRCRPGLFRNNGFERDTAVGSVAAPPLHQGGGEADIADGADVRAAVG